MKYSTLKELFDYVVDENDIVEPAKLIRKSDKKIAGNVTGRGYRQIRIGEIQYSAHRLIWCFHKGEYPTLDIDHIDRNKLNNRIENLREISHKENCQNIGAYKNNRHGVKGIYFNKQMNKWQSHIMSDGKRIHLGCYEVKEDAIEARKQAELKYHPYYNVYK